ncbi:MAG: methyl-accepting chemotaxis protein [Symbiobacteriaceae bacterium]|nr:methyl-accepting chemotaxis protein [Symbiobacteriaceae bacterium]
MSRLSFKWRTIVPTLIVLTIGFTVMTFFTASSAFSSLNSIDSDRLLFEAHEMISHVTKSLTEVLTAVSTMTPVLESDIVSGEANREAWVRILQGLARQNHSIDAIFIYIEPNRFDGRDEEFSNQAFHDPSGIFAPYVTVDGGSISLSTVNANSHRRHLYYQNLMMAKSETLSGPYLDMDSGKWIITLGDPIVVNGQTIGFVAANFRLDALTRFLVSYAVLGSDKGLSALCDLDGQVAVSNTASMVGTNVIARMDRQIAAKTQEALRDHQVQLFEGYSTTFGEQGFYAVAPFTVAETGEYLFFLITMPASVVNANASFLVIVIVVLAVLTLIATLLVLFLNMNGFSRSLLAIDDRLSLSASAVLSASTQIAAASDVLAQGGIQQAAGIEETSATMNQASQMVQNTAANTQRALQLSEEASAAVEKGHARVTELISSMEELSHSSDEIGRIIKIIDDIAFQTNILALNAAVEAARAGDDGRGFAVVASEVGSLAHQSAEAASSTAQIIERNLDLSRRGVDSSIEVGAALGNISVKNTEVYNLMQQISVSGQEQASAAEQINIVLSQMEDITQSNAAVAEESSAASSELKTQADYLNELMVRLRALINGGSKYVVPRVKAQVKTKAPAAPQQRAAQPRVRTPQTAERRLPTPPPKGQPHIVSPNEVIPLEKDNRF